MQTEWIKHPTILKSESIELLPLEQEHLEELFIAGSDKALWALTPTDCSDRNTFFKAYEFAIEERKFHRQYPFVIRHRGTGKLIGSTRLFDLYPADKKLEIGWTWIQREHWGSRVNPEAKLLLLTFCFETLHANRVQIKTKDDNWRSRKAIEKIGGVFEGILRKDRIQGDGTVRNTAYYSIINDEWPQTRERILKLIDSVKYSD
ncbi:MAG: GNAT family N-acetyltransferase [Saprospiraceae bacterium]|nr:GNAT family N-acetyltransferase [Saprospiraceae bacterium]